MLFRSFSSTGRRIILAALAAVACLSGSLTAARAAQQHIAKAAPRARSAAFQNCPAPRDVDAALAASSESMQQAHYKEAAEALQSLAGLHCDPRVSLLLAAAFEGSGDLPKAKETLRQAHRVWPTDDSISASLAREYLRDGQAAEAAQALAHFHASAATPYQEIEMAVLVFLADHRLPSAQALAQIAYKNDPSIRSLLLLANTLQLEGRYKDVIALLGDQRATYAQSPAFLVTLAESEYDAKMFEAAREDLQRSIALDPDLYQSHYLLGNVHLELGEADQAAAEYRLAIALAPDQPRTYYQLALALRAKQDGAGEESALAKAIAIDGHYALAHSEMGRILLDENRLPEAVVQLNLAIQDNPSAEQPYNLLARAYDRLGDLDKAKAMAARLSAVRSANHRGSAAAGSGAMQPSRTTGP